MKREGRCIIHLLSESEGLIMINAMLVLRTFASQPGTPGGGGHRGLQTVYCLRAKSGHSLFFGTANEVRIFFFYIFKELKTNQKKKNILGHLKII